MALSKIDVENMVAGEVNVANGGTGLSSGTTNQFLKFTGSTTLASAADNEGGLVKLITTTVSSSVASVDFDSTYINSTYPTYKIIFKGLTLSGNDNLGIRFGASGSLNTSSDHIRAGMADSQGGTSFGGISGTDATHFPFGGDHENMKGSVVQSGECTLYDLTTNNGNKTCVYHAMIDGANSYRYNTKGFIRAASQQCNILSLMTSGSATIDAGRVTLYGLKE